MFESKQQIFIVMELCAGGDLYRHLPYSEKDAASITAKICSAIAYMHGRDVVHRDCKYSLPPLICNFKLSYHASFFFVADQYHLLQ